MSDINLAWFKALPYERQQRAMSYAKSVGWANPKDRGLSIATIEKLRILEQRILAKN